MLMNIGLNSPRIEKYALLYPSSPSLQKELCNYYSVVVNLCTRMVVFVRKPVARQIANALRKSFEDEFGSFQRELGRLGTAVKEEASIAAKQQQNLDSQEGARERKESALYRATGTIFRKETASELAQLRKMRENILKSRFLASCSQYNPEISLNQARRKGASKWILRSKDYQLWRNTYCSSTLLCSGIVGSGKTVVCASVIEDLTINKPVGYHLAYFFCRYDEAVSLNAREVMGSLARQFFQNLPVEALRLKDKDPNAGVATLDIQQIVDAMLLVLPQARVYIMVLDGLDDCRQKEVNALIDCLQSLAALSGFFLKIFWSCRTDFVSRFPQRLRPDFQVQISSLNNGPEISNFIEVALVDALESGKLKLRCPEIIIQIQEDLEVGAQEMLVNDRLLKLFYSRLTYIIRFLWVVFQIDSICAQHSDHDILRSLRDLPKGLPETFRRMLRRLQDSPFANPSLARKILEIVAGAQRPLNLDELGEAISVTPGDTLWDNSKLVNDVHKVLECCGSLLVVDEEFSTIHFAHSSIKEHLITEPNDLDIVEYHIDLARADSDLGRLCVTYLNSNVFSSQLTKSNGQLQSYAVNVPATVVQSTLSKHESITRVALAMLKGRRSLKKDTVLDFQKNSDSIQTDDTHMKNNFFFLSYCREHWLHHTKKIHLLSDDEVYPLWNRLVTGSTTTVELPWAPEEISSCGELLISWLRANGHPALTRRTIEQLWDTEITREIPYHLSNELSWTGYRFEQLLGILSDKNDRRTLSLKNHGWMKKMLELAVEGGWELLVELLLQRQVNLNAHSKSSISALRIAISENRKNIVTLLINHGADINYSNQNYGTALQAAALQSEDISIFEFLLERGANVNARSGKYGTALIAAASKNNVRAIELLVGAGADINASHGRFGTALIASISDSDHALAVETLLHNGADPNARGGTYGTALIAAASRNNVRAIELLVDARADINASHEEYGTVLTGAFPAFNNSLTLETLKNLLAKGADVNALDGRYGTALIKAVYLSNMLVVDLLLDAGADVNAHIDTRSTALDVLLQKTPFNGGIFDRLISRGADVNYKTPGQKSPLVVAVESSSYFAVKGLLDAGANVSLTGETMSSLLEIAAKQKSLPVVRALLDHDLYAATEKLEIYSSPNSKKTIKETMRVLKTDEDITRVICHALAKRLRTETQPHIKS